jgi:hypothetical protein
LNSQSSSKYKLTLSDKEKEELKKLRNKKEKSIEERLKDVQISRVEEAALDLAFELILDNQITINKKGEKEVLTSFDAKMLARILQRMGMNLTKSEVDLMLWEVDENLDGTVDK